MRLREQEDFLGARFADIRETLERLLGFLQRQPDRFLKIAAEFAQSDSCNSAPALHANLRAQAAQIGNLEQRGIGGGQNLARIEPRSLQQKIETF